MECGMATSLTLKIEILYDSAITLLRIKPREISHYIKDTLCFHF